MRSAFLGCSGCGLSGGFRGRPRGYCGSEVVASLVWGFLGWPTLAEGAAASVSFGVIVLGMVCELVGGMVLVSFFFWKISMAESQST